MIQEKQRKSQRPQIAITPSADAVLDKAKELAEKKGVPMSKGALASKAIMEAFG